MCRYAIHTYKRHYVCFDCRKAFKPRNAPQTLELCPDCGKQVQRIGLDIKAPKRSDKASWKAAHMLHNGGIRFDSCGCNGPGFRPRDPKQVEAFLAEQRNLQAGEGAQLLEKFST